MGSAEVLVVENCGMRADLDTVDAALEEVVPELLHYVEGMINDASLHATPPSAPSTGV